MNDRAMTDPALTDPATEHRIDYVERVFGFWFQGRFRTRVGSMECPHEDLEAWYRNAQVFARVTLGQATSDEDKARLLVMVESARFAAMAAAERGEQAEFDFSGYGFPPAFVAAWSPAIVREMRAQWRALPRLRG
jgi:hypothetical protein